MFMWLVINDALLTNHARMKRGMAHSDLCALCNQHCETVLHILRDFNLGRNLWTSIDNSLANDSFFHLPLLQWVEVNIMAKTRRSNGVRWPLMLLPFVAPYGRIGIYLFLKVKL